jgi:hypothetical protein
MLWSWTLQVTGTAPGMMGDTAEQWTASDLRKLRHRGWRVVNHFVLAKDDIDHVLIGPGGTYAIETKWSATSWSSEFGRARLREATRQAEANARRLRLWHPFLSRRAAVTPLVVLWGGGVKAWDADDQISSVDGVTVLAGQSVPAWFAGRSGHTLREDEIEELWTALDAQVARRDPVDALSHPIPASVSEVMVSTGSLLTAAVIGVVSLGQLVRFVEPWWLALLTGAIAVLPAVVLIRRSMARPVAWGWVLGLGLPTGALFIAEALYRVTHY